MSGVHVALLEHDRSGDGAAAALASALRAQGAEAEPIVPRGLPDAPLRLRKIGERPGLMPGTFAALVGGGYDVAHAFTAQDAVAALPWARLTGGAVVFSVREPLGRHNIANRRWRLALLRLALERSAVVVAADERVAESVRRWMAVDPRVLDPADATRALALYSELARR